jgi:hypothetical protein
MGPLASIQIPSKKRLNKSRKACFFSRNNEDRSDPEDSHRVEKS